MIKKVLALPLGGHRNANEPVHGVGVTCVTEPSPQLTTTLNWLAVAPGAVSIISPSRTFGNHRSIGVGSAPGFCPGVAGPSPNPLKVIPISLTVVSTKFDEVVVVPSGVVNEIGPVVAPTGTVACTEPSGSDVNVAATPLNETD